MKEENITFDYNSDEIDYANKALFKTQEINSSIIKAESVKDIQLALDICRKNRLKLSVISQGKNWGFGSKVPAEGPSILLDLSLMNSIISYDSHFGTIRIEPGVTFRDVEIFLSERGDAHFLNVIGGSPDASIIGNLLQRGDGVGPYSERSEYACSMEVILSNGKIINTGYGNNKYSRLSELVKSGIGPSYQELFYQSNFGVVTKLTIWLVSKPNKFSQFSITIKKPENIIPALSESQRLFKKQILNSPMIFWNDYKQLVNTISFQQTGKNSPISRNDIKKISNNYNYWKIFGGVYTDSNKINNAITSEIVKVFNPISSKVQLLNNRRIFLYKCINSILPGRPFNNLISDWHNTPLLGKTTMKNINSLYWRNKNSLNMDPIKDGCGTIWHSFIIPFRPLEIIDVLSATEEIALEHGFEPVISMVISNERYVKIHQQIIFDRKSEQDDNSALNYHDDMFYFLEYSGYSNRRLGILGHNKLDPILKDNYFSQTIKDSLDPFQIFSPSQYIPKSASCSITDIIIRELNTIRHRYSFDRLDFKYKLNQFDFEDYTELVFCEDDIEIITGGINRSSYIKKIANSFNVSSQVLNAFYNCCKTFKNKMLYIKISLSKNEQTLYVRVIEPWSRIHSYLKKQDIYPPDSNLLNLSINPICHVIGFTEKNKKLIVKTYQLSKQKPKSKKKVTFLSYRLSQNKWLKENKIYQEFFTWNDLAISKRWQSLKYTLSNLYKYDYRMMKGDTIENNAIQNSKLYVVRVPFKNYQQYPFHFYNYYMSEGLRLLELKKFKEADFAFLNALHYEKNQSIYPSKPFFIYYYRIYCNILLNKLHVSMKCIRKAKENYSKSSAEYHNLIQLNDIITTQNFKFTDFTIQIYDIFSKLGCNELCALIKSPA